MTFLLMIQIHSGNFKTPLGASSTEKRRLFIIENDSDGSREKLFVTSYIRFI